MTVSATHMNALFGPVNSRRLGISQGIDLLPAKICTYNCIYCEAGPTTLSTCERREYIPTAGIIAEIGELLKDRKAVERLDVFTITASGEPTLHSGLGKIIAFLKNAVDRPVAVLTNGSLLYRPEVRDDLAGADIVIPSLDAAREESYRKINRPAACAPLDKLLEGLALFRQEFSGKFWLEVLLAKGINDSPEDLAALKKATRYIRPDRVQLNSVARPPLEPYALPLSRKELEAAASRLDGPVEIVVDFTVRRRKKFHSPETSTILQMLKRRPCTAQDVSEALNLETLGAEQALSQLSEKGLILKTTHHDKEYFQIRP